jgi:hypothetical protein
MDALTQQKSLEIQALAVSEPTGRSVP